MHAAVLSLQKTRVNMRCGCVRIPAYHALACRSAYVSGPVYRSLSMLWRVLELSARRLGREVCPHFCQVALWQCGDRYHQGKAALRANLVHPRLTLCSCVSALSFLCRCVFDTLSSWALFVTLMLDNNANEADRSSNPTRLFTPYDARTHVDWFSYTRFPPHPFLSLPSHLIPSHPSGTRRFGYHPDAVQSLVWHGSWIMGKSPPRRGL